jgi:hypothetical protein
LAGKFLWGRAVRGMGNTGTFATHLRFFSTESPWVDAATETPSPRYCDAASVWYARCARRLRRRSV